MRDNARKTPRGKALRTHPVFLLSFPRTQTPSTAMIPSLWVTLHWWIWANESLLQLLHGLICSHHKAGSRAAGQTASRCVSYAEHERISGRETPPFAATPHTSVLLDFYGLNTIGWWLMVRFFMLWLSLRNTSADFVHSKGCHNTTLWNSHRVYTIVTLIFFWFRNCSGFQPSEDLFRWKEVPVWSASGIFEWRMVNAALLLIFFFQFLISRLDWTAWPDSSWCCGGM